METITKEQAKRLIEEYNDSQIFTVTFVKRTTGEIRTMNCRKGVVKYLTGGEMKYNPKEKGLVGVFDMQKGAYRTIALENIKSIRLKNSQYIVIE